MNIRNEIKSYVVASGFTFEKLAAELNARDENSKASQQSLSNKLSRGSIRYDECKQIADILGYEIVWKRKDQ